MYLQTGRLVFESVLDVTFSPEHPAVFVDRLVFPPTTPLVAKDQASTKHDGATENVKSILNTTVESPLGSQFADASISPGVSHCFHLALGQSCTRFDKP